MSDLVGNPEDRSSHNEAQIGNASLDFATADAKKTNRLSDDVVHIMVKLSRR